MSPFRIRICEFERNPFVFWLPTTTVPDDNEHDDKSMISAVTKRVLSRTFVRRRAFSSAFRPQSDDPGDLVEPGDNDCCGNGCQECVWTVYWDALAKLSGSSRRPTAFEQLEARLQREAALSEKQKLALRHAASKEPMGVEHGEGRGGRRGGGNAA